MSVRFDCKEPLLVVNLNNFLFIHTTLNLCERLFLILSHEKKKESTKLLKVKIFDQGYYLLLMTKT